jgi:hypothetical protein
MNQFGRLISSVLDAGWQQFPAFFPASEKVKRILNKKSYANQCGFDFVDEKHMGEKLNKYNPRMDHSNGHFSTDVKNLNVFQYFVGHGGDSCFL